MIITRNQREELGRIHPKVISRQQVACQSERTVGAHILLIIIHDTEGWNYPGPKDLTGLGSYFNNLLTQASAHVGDDREAQSAIYVNGRKKAWACRHYNSASLNIEQIGFSTDDWKSDLIHPQLQETARWCARWSLLYDIPLAKGAVNDGAVTHAGILQHRDLGALGGGHSDVSADYPIVELRHIASLYKQLLIEEHNK